MWSLPQLHVDVVILQQVAENHLGPDDRVIVVTHEPNWVLDHYFGSKTARNTTDLIRYVLGKRCALRLAGDIHHYTRHVPIKQPISKALSEELLEQAKQAEQNPQPTLVVCGGGGAFLHPTHLLDRGTLHNDGQVYRRVAAYPSPKVSRSYGILNILRFRQMNWQFDLVCPFGGGLC